MPQEETSTPTGLPEGISKPLAGINAQDQSGLIAILTAFALGLVLLSIGTRIYARHEFRLYRIDDFTFFAATGFAVVQFSLIFEELRQGLGKSEDQISPTVVPRMQKLGFAADLLYLIVLFLSKCCVSFLFLNLTPGNAHMRVIWTTVAASSTWVITSILLEAIRCNPSHPWTDDMVTCTNAFVRWAVIAALDAAIEFALVANAIYIVFDLQMAIKSKIIVVGAFSWRIPNIAFTIARLVFLSHPFEPSSSHIWNSRVVSTTQLSVGYTILATVVPYLKPFMMAYERPKTSYSSNYPSSTGTRFKLSNLDKNSQTASAALRTMDQEDEGALIEDPPVTLHHNIPQVKKRRRSAVRMGKLRPERTKYEVSASAAESGSHERSEHGSEDSEQMIITKGVEWSVKYHSDDRAAREGRHSVAGTEESRVATPGPDDITVIRSHV
ncbi:hypothetical protein DM02DRAFT_341538 [Periconia macrospinosa]|uniref:Rhodopsin domain-containing protein n=1 Tax=Periconia macrospinosa TaxID=97972 RepID=A0A2V1DTS5_9PLEO|nr:hypothetical protein DM02DRAFT_341538 [Periconia macrospinosa]